MNQNFFAEVVNMADLLNFFEDQREQQKRQLQYQTQNEPSELEKLHEELVRTDYVVKVNDNET